MYIRQEELKDHHEVYQLIKETFQTAQQSDGHEQDLVVNLRQSQSFIPELSLVALQDNKIVGHILFTIAYVNNTKVLALAPLAVLPQYQNMGIGISLIECGHDIARRLGYEYSVVLGSPEYYMKAGYMVASQYGIYAPFEVENEYFMAICLTDCHHQLNGILQYDQAFGI